MWIQSYTFQGKAKLDRKKPNWNTLAKSKNIRRPKTHQKAKTVIKSSVKWDAATGKCSFMLIFGVLVVTCPNCFIVLWKILVLWKLIYRSISWSPKGCKNSQNNADKVVCLMTSLKLWWPKWCIEIWATWDCRSLWCSRDLLASCTTELYICSADLTALVRVIGDYQSYLSLGGLNLCKSGCLINFVTLKVGACQCTQPSFHEWL